YAWKRREQTVPLSRSLENLHKRGFYPWLLAPSHRLDKFVCPNAICQAPLHETIEILVMLNIQSVEPLGDQIRRFLGKVVKQPQCSRRLKLAAIAPTI